VALRDILGQERTIEILKRSLSTGLLPHAYIFVGEEGIGKFFTAINLAKALNCEKSEIRDGRQETIINNSSPVTEPALSLSRRHPSQKEIEACDNCPSCIEIDKGIHPDVLFIKPEGDQIKIDQKGDQIKIGQKSDQIKIGQIRTAGERLSLRALKGRRKVMIIDDAHTMNIASANALLKTLEEPPEGTVIILITPSPHHLPATVLSRCQRLSFGLLKRKVIEDILISKGMKKEDAFLTASLSDGRIGRALSGNLGNLPEERELFLTLFNSANQPFYDVSTLLEGIAKGEEERLGNILYWGEIWFRDLLVFKVTRDHSLLINQDKGKEIGDISERLFLNQLQDSFRVIHDTSRFITLRANKQLALEVMMIRLAETLLRMPGVEGSSGQVKIFENKPLEPLNR
jgi:DNA polymerase-3 subunit delta'